MPCVSLLLCLYRTVLVTALPPHTPSNVESACNDSWCEEPFKSTLHWGWRGDVRICGVFAKVSQDFWRGLSENPPFNKTLDNVNNGYTVPSVPKIFLIFFQILTLTRSFTPYRSFTHFTRSARYRSLTHSFVRIVHSLAIARSLNSRSI